jgi:hypothetical protein
MSKEMQEEDISPICGASEGDIWKEMMELKKKQIRKIYPPNLLK